MFWGLPSALAFYFFVKLLEYIWRKTCCKEVDRDSKAYKILQALQYRTRRWLFVSFLLETAITKTSLAAFNQLAYPSSTNFFQKACFGCCVLFLGLMVVFCFHFYSFLRRRHKKSSVIMLVYAKESRRGYLLDSLIAILHKVIRGFIHSSLVSSHATKLYLLIGLLTAEIVVYAKLRKSFMNMFVFGCLLFYNLSFIGLNFSLLL